MNLISNLTPVTTINEWHYPGIWPHQDCFCRLDIYENMTGTVCVVTELNGNTGASVTNCIENIGKKLQSLYGNHVLIEHYGKESYDFKRDEEYSLVKFVGDFTNPKWIPVTLSEYLKET